MTKLVKLTFTSSLKKQLPRLCCQFGLSNGFFRHEGYFVCRLILASLKEAYGGDQGYSSVVRSLKLSKSTSVSTWMGDRQGRPSAVNLCPFVGVDLNL